LIEDFLTILAEDTLDTLDNGGSLDNILEQLLDVSLQSSVVRAVTYLPLVLSSVKNSLDGEDGHDFLLVTLDVVLEVK